MTLAKYLFLLMVSLIMFKSEVVQGAELRAGKPFPDLVFPSAGSGEPVSVRQFLGQKLVVQIFASW